jgi:outer membrane protein assembly factor BamA
MKHILCIFFGLQICLLALQAQNLNESLSSKKYIIGQINFTGNKKTKDKIILREIPFKTGDTLTVSEFALLTKKSQQNIINTALFNFATIDSTFVTPELVNLSVNVKERWYIWPNPIFEIAERNFNTWLENPNLYRVSYGAYVVKNNFRGRKENIQIRLRLGYAEQLGLAYNIPYLNKKQNLGLGFSFSYSRNHEIQYKSAENKQVFYKDPDRYVREELGARVRLGYRIGIYGSHSMELRYNQANVVDTIKFLTSNYFSRNATKTQFFSLNFQFRQDERDYRPYPLTGFLAILDVTKVGFGLLKQEDFTVFRTEIVYNRYDKLCNRFYLAEGIKFKLSPNVKQPYFVQRGLGFSDFVRGYEVYVIDGQNFGLFKSNIKYQLVKNRVQKLNWVPSEKFNTFYYSFYLNLFADAGYVSDQDFRNENFLANQFLYSTGIGLDFVTYYDLVFRIEGTLNGLNKTGIFLHLVAPI